MKDSMSNFIALVLIWIVVSIIRFISVQLESKYKRWIKTDGILLRKEFISSGDMDASTKDRIKVEYEYFVKGKTYRSSRFAPEVIQGTYAGDLKLFDRLGRVGSTIDVYYNPIQPNASVLVIPEAFKRTYYILFSLFLGILSIFSLCGNI